MCESVAFALVVDVEIAFCLGTFLWRSVCALAEHIPITITVLLDLNITCLNKQVCTQM